MVRVIEAANRKVFVSDFLTLENRAREQLGDEPARLPLLCGGYDQDPELVVHGQLV